MRRKKSTKYRRYRDDLEIDFSSYNAMESQYGKQPDGSYILATEYASELMAKEWVDCIDRAVKARDALKPKKFNFKKISKAF